MDNNGWQPIETAPKDGTWVLLWCRSNNPLILVGGYSREFLQDYSWEGWIDRYNGEDVPTPTHWRPLPEPPE